MTARPASLALLCFAAAGCYASHERGEMATGCRGVSGLCGERAPTTARGACVRDGEVFVFRDGSGEIACAATDGDATRFGSVSACASDAPIARHVACCEPSADPLLAGWVFEGSVSGASLRVEETDEGCQMLPDAYPRGPYAPWRPTMLCDDPLAWSLVPLVFTVVESGADGCSGAEYAEHCSAELVDGRIVATIESAPAAVTGCDLAVGDRVAQCAVLPLPAGRYEVVDATGRALGAVTVARSLPAEREAVCTAIPRE